MNIINKIAYHFISPSKIQEDLKEHLYRLNPHIPYGYFKTYIHGNTVYVALLNKTIKYNITVTRIYNKKVKYI